jgi:hypothetical protein
MKNLNLKDIIPFSLFCLFISSNVNTFAQQAITSVTTTYNASPTGQTYSAKGAAGSPNASNDFTYNFGSSATGGGSGDLILNTFTTSVSTYTLYNIPGMYVKMRRNNVSLGAGAVRFLKYDEGAAATGTPGTINIGGSYVDDMEQFFLGNSGFNSGSDNLFQNEGDGNGNNNNIERVDFLFAQGIYTDNSSGAGVAIFERGNVNVHDPVKVALILSMGGALNTPTRFSDVKNIVAADYGTANPLGNKTYVIARRDVGTDANVLISTTATQGVGGVYFPFSAFTIDGVPIPNGTRINGYVILPNDFSGDRTQIQDYTNATYFPTNTGSGGGGIDLTAITGIFKDISASVNITLALELEQFNARFANNQVNLAWTTNKEQNVNQFVIERSFDGQKFEQWKTVQAQNLVRNNYAQTDDLLGVVSTSIYYRLIMIDRDGTKRFSKVILVNTNKAAQTVFSISPSLINNHYTIANIQSDKASVVKIQIFGADGIVMKEYNKQIQTGSNNLLIDQLENVKPGMYFISILMDDKKMTTKMIKQ